MSDASIYYGQSTQIPVVNSLGNVFEEVQVATAAQTVFTLVSFIYTPNTKTLLVFRNGLIQRPGVQYSETSGTQVTFAAGLTAGDVVLFYAFAVSGVIPTTSGNVPQGGTANQILAKINSSDFNTRWVDPATIAGSLFDAPVSIVPTATTVNLVPLLTTTRNISFSGIATITGFQVANGQLWAAKSSGTFTLVNSASILCPNGTDISVVPNATFFFRAVADNVVEILCYALPQTAQPLTRVAPVATTSGTFIDFLNIPSWVTSITVNFAGISVSGSAIPQVQIGSSAGLVTGGYVINGASVQSGATGTFGSSTAWALDNGGLASYIKYGSLVLTLANPATNTWLGVLNVSEATAGRVTISAGSGTLPGVLDRVRLGTSNGTDTFDNGFVSIVYE